MSFLHVLMLAKDFYNLGSYPTVRRINKSIATTSEINNYISVGRLCSASPSSKLNCCMHIIPTFTTLLHLIVL